MASQQKQSALVIGSSGGIGRACAALLTKRGSDITALSRSADGLDLTNEASIIEAASKLSGHTFDFVLVATGILEVSGSAPEKSFGSLTTESMAGAFTTNAIGSALIYKNFQRLLAKDRRSVFAVLSARVGSIGDNKLGGWMSYRASKAALNQFIRCAALEETRKNRESIVVTLHPGTIETELTMAYAKDRFTASPDQAAVNILDVLSRLTPNETGGFFDYSGRAIPW